MREHAINIARPSKKSASLELGFAGPIPPKEYVNYYGPQ
jgi:hypothetical protein